MDTNAHLASFVNALHSANEESLDKSVPFVSQDVFELLYGSRGFCLLAIRLPSASHVCSIGFRSEKYAGCAIHSISSPVSPPSAVLCIWALLSRNESSVLTATQERQT